MFLFTYTLFLQKGTGFLNRFHSGFLEPWCRPVNQPAFPPGLSGTTVIEGVSSTECITQCTTAVATWQITWAFVLLLQIFVRFILFHWVQTKDTPTDVLTIRTGKTSYLLVSVWNFLRLWTNLSKPIGRNTPNGLKFSMRTGTETETVPRWWKLGREKSKSSFQIFFQYYVNMNTMYYWYSKMGYAATQEKLFKSV